MFTIEIRYQTGDSFNTFTETEKIGAAFRSLTLAQKALLDIKEHHDFIKEIDGNRDYHPVIGCKDKIKEKANDLISKSWFCSVEDDEFFEEDIRESDRDVKNYPNNLITEGCAYWQSYLKVDCGSKMQKIHAFWSGYFEKIISAKVVVYGDDNEIEFH